MSAAPRPGGLGDGRFLLALGARLYRLQDEALAGLERPLTLPQFRLLQRVHAGHTSPTALARMAGRSLPTMSESIEGLVRRGLLTRQPSTRDRRAVVIALTAEGEALRQAADETLSKLADDLLATLPSDRPMLMAALQSLYDAAGDRLYARGR
jgi:DNA-binding MarR family transcriptional regulator